MKTTKNYNMTYPEEDDYFDVSDFQNMLILVDELMKEVSDSGTKLSNDATYLYNQAKAQMNTIQQRMNAFTTLKDGSTSGDAELQDIRVAYDGRLYEGAGNAVRAQTADLYEIITGADSYAWSTILGLVTPMKYRTGNGIQILKERFPETGILTKLIRGTFEKNDTVLELEAECTVYIIQFNRTPGTMYVPSADNIEIISSQTVKFGKNGIAQCYISVEKGQYIGVDGLCVAHITGHSDIPYMEYDSEKETMEYYGFNPYPSTDEEINSGSLAMTYKIDTNINGNGMIQKIQNMEAKIENIQKKITELSKLTLEVGEDNGIDIVYREDEKG